MKIWIHLNCSYTHDVTTSEPAPTSMGPKEEFDLGDPHRLVATNTIDRW